MSVDAAARMSAPAPRDPSWVALAAGQATLAVWLGLLLAADGLGAGSSDVLARAVSPTGAAALGVFGFAVPVRDCMELWTLLPSSTLVLNMRN